MPRHRVSHADDIAFGAVDPPNRAFTGVTVHQTGLLDLGTPIAAAAATVVNAQAVAGAVASVPLAVAGGVTLDVPRAVSIVSSNAGDTGAGRNVTVFGRDRYGRPQSETITPNGTTTVVGNKAFASVSRVAAAGAYTGNLSVGISARIGLPQRILPGGFLSGILGDNTADAGTIVFGSDAAPTDATGDSIGTYQPAGTLNGTNRFRVRAFVNLGDRAYGIEQPNVTL